MNAINLLNAYVNKSETEYLNEVKTSQHLEYVISILENILSDCKNQYMLDDSKYTVKENKGSILISGSNSTRTLDDSLQECNEISDSELKVESKLEEGIEQSDELPNYDETRFDCIQMLLPKEFEDWKIYNEDFKSDLVDAYDEAENEIGTIMHSKSSMFPMSEEIIGQTMDLFKDKTLIHLYKQLANDKSIIIDNSIIFSELIDYLNKKTDIKKFLTINNKIIL